MDCSAKPRTALRLSVDTGIIPGAVAAETVCELARPTKQSLHRRPVK
ncbi:hypothetical protein PL263_01765 [Methylomonas sp. EFPC3]|nr:hypothetical protein [Methylomonas sp. EFPC3]WFP50762.1 hypothetical protein PL263_01765 [Methylomonas sp. EFPC3]